MSEFMRTPQGIRNYRLFYGVDAVVFCEGAPSDTDTHVGVDHVYWTIRLSKILHGTSFQLHNSGSKTAVLSKLQIALGNNEIDENFMFYGCVDADYDSLEERYGLFFRAGKLFVTNGCDVEADIIDCVQARRLALSFLPRARQRTIQRLDTALNHLEIYMHKLGMLNYEMRRHGIRWFDSKGDIVCICFDLSMPKVTYLNRNLWLEFKKNRLREKGNCTIGHVRRSHPADVAVGMLPPTRTARGMSLMPGGIICSLLSRLINVVGETMRPWGKVSRERVLDQAVMLFNLKHSASI